MRLWPKLENFYHFSCGLLNSIATSNLFHHKHEMTTCRWICAQISLAFVSKTDSAYGFCLNWEHYMACAKHGLHDYSFVWVYPMNAQNLCAKIRSFNRMHVFSSIFQHCHWIPLVTTQKRNQAFSRKSKNWKASHWVHSTFVISLR